ncbi:MAG: DNA-3-methyladenine glycosylase I [Actinomycetales bacterium]|nr:DNA-3-methyladenine glycosylase I [Actinomycetales bacterium]
MSWKITLEYDDGRTRCGWPGQDPLYVEYHDAEWGVPVVGDQAMFERIALEGFQAGLSWITILKRREGFRRAFYEFDLEKVAALTSADVERLMQDESIIRNRAKILATVHNAGLILEMQKSGQSISDVVWSFAPPIEQKLRPELGFQWIATSPESDALSKHLRKLGFKFVGSTTMYALMQATGMLNDHAPGCFRRGELSSAS